MSKVVTDSIYSENLKAWRAYTIYLPKSYEAQPDRKYPILYLLHGVIGTNLGWFHDQRANEVADQLMDSGEACEMIIVSPNAGGNPPTKYQNGYFNMPGWPYEDFFYQEFMPYIEKTYRVIGDKQHRAIAGLSMGGGGTASYAQRHPDLFCAAYAMSALMDLPAVGGIPAANPDDMMGKLNRSVQEHSCIKYVTEADDARKAALRRLPAGPQHRIHAGHACRRHPHAVPRARRRAYQRVLAHGALHVPAVCQPLLWEIGN